MTAATPGEAFPPALTVCDRCGSVVTTAHTRPECDANYAARYGGGCVEAIIAALRLAKGRAVEDDREDDLTEFRRAEKDAIVLRAVLAALAAPQGRG